MTFDKKTLLVSLGDEAGLSLAAEMLRGGELVIFPTETVYGLGASAYDADAAYAVFEAKGRPHDNPLIVHVAKPEDAESIAYTNKLYYRLARAFMPGPITIILKKRDIIPDEVTAGGNTVGIRCPSHPVAHRFIELAGVPVAAPSANLSGRPSPTRFSHCTDDMMGRVSAIIDGGECDIGLESTVVLLTGEDSLKILRPGGVSRDALLCVVSDVTVADGLREGEIPLSPGMKYKHYAPRTPLFLLKGSRTRVTEYVKGKIAAGERCLFISYDEDSAGFGGVSISLGGADDVRSHAKRLFAALREADRIGETRTIDVIYSYAPSEGGDGLDPAIYNRLIRAANHTIVEV
ncbi:MAG: threonylcarbamoyl-AMP synthase [Firmicutes bacterium]|nr:threonylcarbamoyl-AMP synthase [Bacillota bacterium]